MAGRRPKPTAIKKIEGNAGRRPLNEKEPVPDGRPIMPGCVQGRAADLWREYSRIGYWLTAADSELLAIWCITAARIESAKHPSAPLVAQFRLLSVELGFSPASRPKLAAPRDKPAEPSPTEKFFRPRPA